MGCIFGTTSFGPRQLAPNNWLGPDVSLDPVDVLSESVTICR